MKRPTLPHHHRIARYWLEHTDEDFVIDLAEPSCFACHWWSDRAPSHPPATIERVWQRSGLERCHLRPHALGGSAEANNLVLLCPTCHEEAPDWINPTQMLEWIRQRPSWYVRRTTALQREWQRRFGDRPLPLHLADDPILMDEYLRRFRRALDLAAGLHQTRLSDATIVTAMAAALDGRLELPEAGQS